MGYDRVQVYFHNVLPYQFWPTPLITGLIIILEGVDNKHKTAAREDVSRICLPCQQPLELDKSKGWLEDTSVRLLLPYNNTSQGNM
jgi:hypothetical protein